MALATLTGSHYHNQTTPSTTWVIVHSLNTMAPIVDCWIGEVRIEPQSVVATNALTCTITFASPQIGEALLV